MIKRSTRLEEFIKSQEKYSPAAFEDFGRTSIGYGTKGVPGQTMSEPEALKAMRAHLDTTEQEVARHLTRTDLPQNKQDVIIDLAYNMGLPRFLETGFLDLVNQGKDDEAAEALLRMNKARDPKTGNLIELGGLTKRAQDRRAMWDEVLGEQAPEAIDYAALSDPETLPSSESIDYAALSDPDPSAIPSNTFNLATDISNTKEAEQLSKVERLAREFNVPAGQVEALLSEFDEETTRLKLKSDYSKDAPRTAQFASDLGNNAVVKKAPDVFHKTEFLSKILGKGEIEKGLNTSMIRLLDGITMLNFLKGGASTEETLRILNENDKYLKENKLNNEITKSIEGIYEETGRAWDALTDSEVREKGKSALSATGDWVGSIGRFFFESVKDPKAFVAFMLENSGTSILAGAAGAVGGPGLSSISAGSAEALVAYGAKVRELIEPYRDPITGQINLQAIQSDPELMGKLNAEAATYASLIGLSSAVFQKVGMKAVGKGAAGAVGTVAVGAASEAGGEFVASSGGQLAAGKEVDVRGNIQESAVELVAGTPGTVTTATAGYIVDRAGTVRTGTKLKEANKANDDTIALSSLKEEVKNNPAIKQFPDQVKAHVEAVTEAEPVTPPFDFNSDSEPTRSEVDAAVRINREETQTGTVAITPSEWEAFNRDRGVDPQEALQVFPLEVRRAFADNKQSDSSVIIPMADWVMSTMEDPEIEVIARVNANQLNTIEANEIVDAFEKNPMIFLDTSETTTSREALVEETIPEIPEDAWTFVETGEGEMVPINTQSPFTSIEETYAHRNFVERLSRAIPKADKGFLNDVALLETRRLKMRAEVTGLTLQEAMDRIQFKKGPNSQVTTPTIDKDFFSVVLGTNANPTAVVHELAHVWLFEMSEDFNMMRDIDPDTLSPDLKAYREAMDTAAKLLGMESLDEVRAGDPNKITRAQEVFAQTAEKFFMDNKSEDSRIKQLMDRMKDWMLKYYDRLRALSQRKYPTLQMNEEVQRMFNSILAANNVATDAVNSIFPEPTFTRSDFGTTKKAEEYFSALHMARSQAIAEVAGKSMLNTNRENDMIFELEHDRVLKEVEAEVDARPAMIFGTMLRDQYTEAKKSGAPDPRISYESMRDSFFEGDDALAQAYKKSVPFYLITGKKKGGVSVDEMRLMLGLKTNEELKAYLDEVANRDNIIMAELDRLEPKIAESLIPREQIAQAAEDAVNSKSRFDLIKREVEIFKEMMGAQYDNLVADLINAASNLTRGENYDALRFQAQAKIFTAKSVGFNSANYLRDVGVFARKASKYFKGKDLEMAMDMKVREGMKFLEYLEAKNAERAKVTSAKRVARLVKIARTIDQNFNNYDKALIQRAAQVLQDISEGNEPQPITMEELKDMVTTVTPDQVAIINKAIASILQTGPIGPDLTVAGMIATGHFARSAVKAARQARVAYVKGKKVNIIEIGQEVAASIAEGNQISYDASEDTGTIFTRGRAAKTKARAAIFGVFRSDESALKSELGKIVTDVINGDAEKVTFTNKHFRRVEEAYKKIPVSFKERLSLGKKPSDKGIISFQATPTESFQFNSFDEIETAMLHMGTESGARGFTMGNLGLPEGFIPAVTENFWNFIDTLIQKGTLPKEYLDVVQTKWDIMKEIYPELAKAIEESDGIPVGKIEGSKIRVGNRTLEGAYFPKIGLETLASDNFISELDGVSSMMNLNFNKDLGITKERSHEAAIPLNIRSFESYIRASGTIIHTRSPLTTLHKLLQVPELKEVMETRRPGMYEHVVYPWMSRILMSSRTTVKGKDYSGLDKTLEWVRRNSGITFFLGNLKTILSQPLGLVNSWHEVGSYYTAKASTYFLTNPKYIFTVAAEKSAVMRSRFVADININVRGEEGVQRSASLYQAARKLTEKGTYVPIHMMQNLVDVISWTGAYFKALNQGDEQFAISYADSVVSKSQGSSNIAELANIQTGSSVSRIFTAFATVPLVNYEQITEPLRRGGMDMKTAVGVVQATMASVLIPVLLETLLLDPLQDFLSGKDEEDEEDKYLTGFIRGMGQAGSSVFMGPVGTAAGSLGAKVAGIAIDEWTDSEVSPNLYPARVTPPAIKKLEDGFKGAVALSELVIKDEEMTARQITQVLDLATILLGVGINAPNRVIMYNEE